MNWSKMHIVIGILSMLTIIAWFSANAQDSVVPTKHRLHGILDGKTFIGTMNIGENEQPIAEIITFREGKFRSVAGDSLGFGYGTYTTHKDTTGIVFDASTISLKDAKRSELKWHGTIKGKTLEATAINYSDGKPQQTSFIIAELKPLGKSK
jgi:hypothetical protein